MERKGGGNIQETSANEGTVDEPDHKQKQSSICCSYVIEPAVFLYCLVTFPSFSITRQYLYAKIGKEYSFDYLSRSEAELCTVNSSDPDYIIQERIQSETSTWLMYMNIVFCTPALISTIFLGSYSDRGGRKIALLIPVLGGIIEITVYLIDSYFDFPIPFLLVGHVLHGITGSYMIFISSAFSYVADITTVKQRTFRLTFLSVIIELGIGSLEVGMGYWVKASGFAYPLLSINASLTLLVLYIIIVIPETVSRQNSKLVDVVRAMYNLYFKEPNDTIKRRWKLQILMVATFFIMVPATSLFDVLSLKMFNYPLCFNTVLVGYFGTLRVLMNALAAFLFVKFMERFLSDVWLLAIGCVGGMAYFITITIAKTKLVMFLVPVVGMLQTVPLSIIRAMVSKLVDTHEQGAVLSSIASIQTLSGLVGHLIFNVIYSATVASFDGISFIIATAFLAVAIVIILSYQVALKKENNIGVNQMDEQSPLIKDGSYD